MAPGLKTWLTVVGVGIALVSGPLLPIGTLGPTRPAPEPTPERDRYEQLRSQARLAIEAVERTAWLEGALASLAAARDEGRRVVIELPTDEAPPLSRAEYAARIAEEVGPAPVADVGVFPRRVASAEGESVPRWMSPHDEYFVGTLDGRPYCFVSAISGPYLARMRAAGSLRPLPDTPVSSFCAFVAAYGLPGADVARWLRSGGMTLALDRRPSRPVRTDAPAALWSFSGLSLDAMACLAGSESACARTFLETIYAQDGSSIEASLPRRIPELWGVVSGQHGAHFASGDRRRLADLEAQFGPDRFRAFWTSDAPVEQAFDAAFDTPVGAWTHEWASARYPFRRAGSDLAAWTWPLLVAAAGVFLALFKARRREV